MTIEQTVTDYLSKNPGKKGSQIATAIGADKTAVNSALHRQLSGKFIQDKEYRWWPVQDAPTLKLKSAEEETFANTPLSKLARYYLACLGQDDLSEVGVWARDKFNNFDYAPLEKLPEDSLQECFQQPAVAQLLNRVRSDRNPHILYVGYPLVIHRFISKQGNTIYRAEPVLLLPVQFDQPNNRGNATLSTDFPIINTAVLKRYSNADNESLMTELLALEDELGFSASDEPPDLDEVARRLQQLRPEWPWLEPCDPDALVLEPAIDTLEKSGIYNRAVMVSTERKPYTQGLENELRELAKLPESAYRDTALGRFVHNLSGIPANESNVSEAKEQTLLEVLPMNSEQREAVRSALTRPLTIITGPPGTGKSQVVTNLLVNAAWRGKTVLFASKNNKAVDVVEARVNNLGTRPLLMRMGSQEYQNKLKEYLHNVLVATATEDDKLEYQEAITLHQKTLSHIEALARQQEAIIEARNRADALEQDVELLRRALGNEKFLKIRKLDWTDLTDKLEALQKALADADKQRVIALDWLLWPVIKNQRYRKLTDTAASLKEAFHILALVPPQEEVAEQSYSLWKIFGETVSSRLEEFRLIKNYFEALQQLEQGISLEQLNHELRQLMVEVSDNSGRLWEGWLRVSPTRLTQKDRQLLSQYVSILQMTTDNRGSNPDKSVWRQYYEMTAKVAHLLTCWAVTALSARGKLPFTPNFFDIVVFDEASQCDIASALPLLYRAKQVVIIGDPKQLSHISGIHKNQDQQFLERYGLEKDYLQWAYSWNSLFDMGRSCAMAEDIISLRDHHRCHADIINFSNECFYEGRLRVATRYASLKRPSPNEAGVRWVDVRGKTLRPANGGALNHQEAAAVVNELRRLVLTQKYKGSIGVVSPFRAQANLITELCSKDRELQHELDQRDFQSNTVHRFQGDERDVMIFSPVISEGTEYNAINFLNRSGNLFNVAITRARGMLLIVGDRNAAAQCEVDYLSKFSRYVEELDSKKQNQEEDLLNREYGPEYPSHVDRSKVSDWEVILYKALYQAGIRTLPQYPIEQYLLDLAVVDGERRLDIEVDGERYHRNWTGELCRRDQIRNQRLFELGWDVKRFWVYQIRDDLEGCVRSIREWLEESKQ